MDYNLLTDATLLVFHDNIMKCLKKDDETAEGELKPYGVREYPDWSLHLQNIEFQLTKRCIVFTPIDISKPEKEARTPATAIMYENIKSYLAYEDSLNDSMSKPYGIREYPDWKMQADSLEKELDKIHYTYTKISW